MANISDLLRQAMQSFESQRLPEAENLYRQIISVDPNHIRALEMLGVVVGGTGRTPEAIVFLQRAIVAGSRSGEAFKNLAVLLHAAGRVAEAQAAAEQGAQVDPNFLEGHFVLGNLLLAQGQPRRALPHYLRVIAMEPRFVPAYVNMVFIHRSWTELAEAERYARLIVQYEPQSPPAHCQLAHLLRDQQKFDAAVAEYHEAIRLDPKFIEAYIALGDLLETKGRHDDSAALFARLHQQDPKAILPAVRLSAAYLAQNLADQAAGVLTPFLTLGIESADLHAHLGNALQAQGKPDDAQRHYERAIALDPLHRAAWDDLGLLFAERSLPEKAIECHQKAIAIKPDDPESHAHLGYAYRKLGHLPEALQAFDKALYYKPDHHRARFNRAMVHLAMGQYAEGWKDYEWRWLAFPELKKPLPKPIWDGSPVPGKTVLLHVDQGFGDLFQFIRYAPLVAQRAGRVIVGCTQDLKDILATTPGVSAVSASGEAPMPFDFHVSVLSLPLLFGTTLETIPCHIPYLSPNPQRVAHWRSKINATPAKLRIGIAWAGRPTHSNDANRSMPLSTLAPLGKIEGAAFYSLQKWKPHEKWGTSTPGLHLIDHTAELENFADTAAFIENLDLVLSIDSAVVHLAGALGKETLVMLSFPPDWRWLRDRSDSPWYPHTRLFRQTYASGWSPVIQEVSATLQQKLQNRQ